jgi:L-alanine-DL-glutamate epimerase-like enolase superfamily enzyme
MTTPLTLRAWTDRPELVRPFIIATGARTHQPVLHVEVSDGHHVGRGQATGVSYRGETPDGLLEQLNICGGTLPADMTRDALAETLPAGGARSALDAALWELEAARSGTTVAALIGVNPKPVESAFTIVLDAPETMAEQARGENWRPLLKVKLGGSPELEAQRMRAVAKASGQARRVIDANAGWTPEQLVELAPLAAELGYELLEQPLTAGTEGEAEDALRNAATHLPLCADESLQTLDDLDALDGLYQAVNIKLDKCGGLTAALAIRDAARARGLSVFVGCMVAPTIALAPAHLLAQGADYADLDGPFWFPDEPATLTGDGLFDVIAPDVWGGGTHA